MELNLPTIRVGAEYRKAHFVSVKLSCHAMPCISVSAGSQLSNTAARPSSIAIRGGIPTFARYSDPITQAGMS